MGSNLPLVPRKGFHPESLVPHSQEKASATRLCGSITLVYWGAVSEQVHVVVIESQVQLYVPGPDQHVTTHSLHVIVHIPTLQCTWLCELHTCDVNSCCQLPCIARCEETFIFPVSCAVCAQWSGDYSLGSDQLITLA